MDTSNIVSAIFCAVLCSAYFAPTALADDQGSVKDAYAAPVVVLGAATGIVVGTPIAAVRMSGRDIKAVFDQYDGDTFSWKFWGRPLALPIGIIEGTIKGCIGGPKNAIRYSKDKPFSKDAFSLEELK